MSTKITEVTQTALAYRLEGEHEGHALRFHLTLGEHRVGSAPDSDVILPFSGVSRQHAMLIATPRSLIVEDRGSTNGIQIDDEPVRRAELPQGARLSVGPVRLVLEALDGAESRLAIRIDLEPASGPAVDYLSRRTSRIAAAGEEETVGLAAVERMLDRCRWSAPVDGSGDVLDALMDEQPYRGACAVRWLECGEPIVLAARGESIVMPTWKELDSALATADEVAGIAGLRLECSPGRSVFAYVTLAANGSRAGVVVDHDGAGAWDAMEAAVARTAARIVARAFAAARPSAVAQRTNRSPRLVFSKGFCRCPSRAMRSLESEIALAGSTDLPVLIHGETGVGKELVARTVHESSLRVSGPFVAINCAALPAELLEAEMFGIGRGVATGVAPRDGRFARAEGGTLFLDEIGELASALQAKLLRALQDREIQPVGAPSRQVDVRVVAATNVNLDSPDGHGGLRSDLYFRLSGCLLNVPPLRQRQVDIPVLLEFFLRRIVKEGVRVHGVTAGALSRLERYAWPGNVRELEHEVCRAARAAVANGGAVVDERCLSEALDNRSRCATMAAIAKREDLGLRSVVEELERVLIEEALSRTGGRKATSARLLGVSRSGLEGRIARLGISLGTDQAK